MATKKQTKKIYVIGKDYCVMEKLATNYWHAHYPLNAGVLKHHFPNRDVRNKQLANAEIIGGVEDNVDYLQNTKSQLGFFTGVDHLKWLRIVSNPIKEWTFDPKFTPDKDIIEDYFETMFEGKLPDIIDIVALSNIHGEKKLNKMLLVGPSNIGKTDALEAMSFIETEQDEFNKALESVSGLSKERFEEFKVSGLIHIDDVKEFSDKMKNVKRTLKIKVMNMGKVEIPSKFILASTTDGSIILNEGDEWQNRMLYLELSDHGNSVTESKIYQADSDKYREHTTFALRKMIKKAFEQKPDQQKLKALQDKYALSKVSDTTEVVNSVVDSLLDYEGISLYDNGSYGVRGRVGLKKQLKTLFEGAYIDKPKSLRAQINKLYKTFIGEKNSGSTIGADGVKAAYHDVFYLTDRYQEMKEKSVEETFDMPSIDYEY